MNSPYLDPKDITIDTSATICALATAQGGALGIIRISGPATIPIVCSVCKNIAPSTPPNSIRYANIIDTNGEVIDEVLVSIFHAPHSYTGEDSAEISCHGSRYILNKVLELLLKRGCRMANPGEYTMRAYLNGKMDLSQAEAVADLIASTNQTTHHIAMSQLRGGISTELSKLREKLLKLTSLLELELDFSDHEELEFADRTELLELAKTIKSHISHLEDTFETGQAIKQGIPVAIIGKTNVGKSTLLNQLLHDERAIVSDIHGTTRDTIEDTIDIHNVTFRFIDTAGIRNTHDKIEKIGIERTFQTIKKARIILWLIDSQPTTEEIDEITSLCKNKKLIIIQNKIDKKESSSYTLPPTLSPVIRLSAKEGYGMDTLEQAIYQSSDIPEINDGDVIITSLRHYEALTLAKTNIDQVIDGLEMQLSSDLIAEDLHAVLTNLGEITGGEITTNEVLGNIFQHFCVGK